jgi:hypothetical protein
MTLQDPLIESVIKEMLRFRSPDSFSPHRLAAASVEDLNSIRANRSAEITKFLNLALIRFLRSKQVCEI